MSDSQRPDSDPQTTRNDIDPGETREWLDALEQVVEFDGPERAQFLLEELLSHVRQTGGRVSVDPTTGYVNTLRPEDEAAHPGDIELEKRIENLIRWNAMAMVMRGNKTIDGIGGHIATYASGATLFETGFNHFFRGPSEEGPGDILFLQGHSSPGFYARAYLEGRLSEEHLERFRQEVGGGGLSSYPHPWLMPDFWSLPTVSMGLNAIMAIYQARFMKYLINRGLIEDDGRRVWAFLGDGESDEPESLGALTVAPREGLDNLVFVVNCNLQRLDGPVRGNGKIIQELEGVFRGAGWNVIKVVWSSAWDDLLAADDDGKLRRRMMAVVDGEYQNYAANGPEYFREKFFGADPELAARVEHLSDDDLEKLIAWGGHDHAKVFAAFRAATEHKGGPSVILAKTIKGFGMGESGQGLNTTHSQKKLSESSLIGYRDRFGLPFGDQEIETIPYHRPADDSDEMKYLAERREALGGPLPRRFFQEKTLPVPELSLFSKLLESSGDRTMSTTMAFVRALTALARDKGIGPHIVPIVADEARTFGMEGLFRQLGIYSHVGQLYRPVDADQLLFYREAEDGQVLQEGITEAGAFSSWAAAGTSYANHGVPMIPFFIYYSMFGFQRIGDLIWAASDMRARGFLMGGTSGRTTLNGEGLQHEDGHSHLLAATFPTCVAYDPTYAYELAVIMHAGLKRMYVDGEDVFYYLTTMNENYPQPAMPEGVESGILKGMYPLVRNRKLMPKARVTLLGSGAILREVLAAAELLEMEFSVAADVWSVTSFTELRREALAVDRWNRLHPGETARVSYVELCLADTVGPTIASTDYMHSFADQIRAWVPGNYSTLGTDGFGRSDSREALRSFFEVDRHHVVVAALAALATEEDSVIDADLVASAIKSYGIDPEAPDPAKA